MKRITFWFFLVVWQTKGEKIKQERGEEEKMVQRLWVCVCMCVCVCVCLWVSERVSKWVSEGAIRGSACFAGHQPIPPATCVTRQLTGSFCSGFHRFSLQCRLFPIIFFSCFFLRLFLFPKKKTFCILSIIVFGIWYVSSTGLCNLSASKAKKKVFVSCYRCC